MDRLAFDLELKLASDDAQEGTIEGYGSVFGLIDRGGDIVLPGAFKSSLGEWRKKKALPPMLWQHDPWQPIGVWTEAKEDERGLLLKGKLTLGVAVAKEARALIADGAVKGLSIGYRCVDHEIDRNTGARKLKKVDLWEISLVTFPMLPEALVSSVKGGVDDRNLERAFRDEGLSHREAKLAVSVVRKHVPRDGGPIEQPPRDGVGDLLMALRKADESLR